MPKYLIIGNSAGGIGAVEAIREADPKGSLAIVSSEPYPAYSRPAITEFLMGERTFDSRMYYRDEGFYKRNNIETHLGVRVTKLDLQAREATLDNGQKLAWEKLLIATGGAPIIPKMEGLNLEGVHTFVTLDDARKLDNAIKNGARRIVVIGGGLIGCSLTHGLIRRGGIEITMVELRERILTTMMDAEASAAVEAHIKKLGVKLITGRSVARLLPSSAEKERVGGVALDNGDEIPCDAVGVAVGVSPQLELVRGTPVKINRGIIVDQHMETSVPGVYSCGDVAESYDFIYGANRVVAIWPNAYFGGRIAGSNMAGKAASYDGCTVMNSFSYFNQTFASAGTFEPAPKDNCEISSVTTPGSYRKVILKDNVIIGFILMGDIQQAGVLYHLMRDRTDVKEFKGKLLKDNFGVVSLPRALRDTWIKSQAAEPSKAKEVAARR